MGQLGLVGVNFWRMKILWLHGNWRDDGNIEKCEVVRKLAKGDASDARQAILRDAIFSRRDVCLATHPGSARHLGAPHGLSGREQRRHRSHPPSRPQPPITRNPVGFELSSSEAVPILNVQNVSGSTPGAAGLSSDLPLPPGELFSRRPIIEPANLALQHNHSNHALDDHHHTMGPLEVENPTLFSHDDSFKSPLSGTSVSQVRQDRPLNMLPNHCGTRPIVVLSDDRQSDPLNDSDSEFPSSPMPSTLRYSKNSIPLSSAPMPPCSPGRLASNPDFPQDSVRSNSTRGNLSTDLTVGKKASTRAKAQYDKKSKQELQRLSKEAREAAKLLKHREKEANKLKLNRKETVAEVQMYVPRSVMGARLHPLVQACELLNKKISECDDCAMKRPVEYEDGSPESQGPVKWIRTCNKEWNEEYQSFLPLISPRATQESTVLYVWTAKEVEELIASSPTSLLTKVKDLKAKHQRDQFFLIISGLSRSSSRSEPSKSKRNFVFRELEKIKIATKCFIVEVEYVHELTEWLFEMTLEIGIRPYKSRRQDVKAELRLEVGGSKGTDYEDTYIKMLSSLTRLTESEAKGIVYRFPTLSKLYSSWDDHTRRGGVGLAESMLVGCSKGYNVDGTSSRRNTGKVTSKRIHDIMFSSRDGSHGANS